MPALLTVRDLKKHYPKVRAVDGVSFEVGQGICFGLLGPNGAGKSTTIEMLEGLSSPTSGEIRFRGELLGPRYRERIGIQFQSTALQDFLTTYLATDEAQQALYEADPRLPAWKPLAATVADDPIVSGFLASAALGVPQPSIPEMGSVWDLWNAAQVQIIKGADPASTWSKMVADVEAAIS